MAVNIGELLATLGIDTTGLDRGIKNAMDSLNNASQKMKQVGQSMSKYITLPLVAAGTAAVKLASDFQTSMTKIETLVGLASGTVNSMKSEVIALSNQTGRSANDLAKALFTVTSAGQRGAAAMEILESSAKASAIGLGDTNDIAKAVTAVLNAYGEENISAAKATDQLLAVVREGNLEASELAPTLGRVIGIASQLGISFAEVGANIATFTRLGVDSSEAVTGLSGIMNSLLRQAPQGAEALAEYGTSFAQLRSEIKQKGLAQALVDLVNLFEGNEEALVKVVPEIRGLSAILGTAASQGQNYVDIAKSISSATGLVDSGFERVSQDSGFQFQQTLEQLKNVGIELGNILLPVVTKILGVIKGLIQKFQGLSNEGKTAIVVLGGIAGAAGPVLVVLGTIGTTIAAIGAPIIGIIALIAALAASYVYLSENWEAVKERISDWSWWRNVLIDMIQFVIEYNPVSTLIKGINELASLFGKDELIPNPFEAIADSLDLLKADTKEYENQFGSFGDAIMAKAASIGSSLAGLLPGGGGGGGGGAAPSAGEDVQQSPVLLPPQEEVFAGYLENFEELGIIIDGVGLKVESFNERLAFLKENFHAAWIEGESFGKGLGQALGTMFTNTGKGIKELANTVLGAIKKMVAGFLAEALAAAIAGAFASSGNPIIGAVLAAVGTGLVLGLFNAIPGFADGGIVPPGYPNDSYPALLTSGEMVTPAKSLPDMGGSMNINISLDSVIEGENLRLILNEVERRRGNSK